MYMYGNLHSPFRLCFINKIKKTKREETKINYAIAKKNETRIDGSKVCERQKKTRTDQKQLCKLLFLSFRVTVAWQQEECLN